MFAKRTNPRARMADVQLAATVRYRLIATVCTCADTSCPCWRARRRSDGTLHCPLCRSDVPTLELQVRGADLRARCTAGCDAEQVQALAQGENGRLLVLYGDDLSRE